jgi:hypothetical protein
MNDLKKLLKNQNKNLSLVSPLRRDEMQHHDEKKQGLTVKSVIIFS